MILKWTLKTWTVLSWLRIGKCRDVVNTITNLRFTQNAGNFRTTLSVLRPSQRCSKQFGSSGMWRYVPDVSRIHVHYIFNCWGVKPQISLVYHASCPSADGYPAIQKRTATVFIKILTFVRHTQMQTRGNHEQICSQWHLVHRLRWRPAIAATDLCLRLCYFVGMLSRWRVACVRLLCTCQKHFWQSLNLRLGVQRSPLLMTGQRKPSVSLLFPRTVFAFQIIMITEGSVQTRWIQTNTKKAFRFRNSSRLACYIS
jgi:hypothetical protein